MGLKGAFNDSDDFVTRDIILRPFSPRDLNDAILAVATYPSFLNAQHKRRGIELKNNIERLAFNTEGSNVYSVILRGGKLGGIVIHDDMDLYQEFALYPTQNQVTLAAGKPISQEQILKAMIDSACVVTLSKCRNGEVPDMLLLLPCDVAALACVEKELSKLCDLNQEDNMKVAQVLWNNGEMECLMLSITSRQDFRRALTQGAPSP